MSGADSTMFLFLAIVYFIVIFISLFGNSVLIHIIRTRHFLKTGTNYLILNQACADLVITMTIMLNMLGDSLFERKWFNGDLGLATCRIYVVLNFLAPFCSIWSLAAIAIDRYFAVTQPLKMSVISRHIKPITFVLWLWSFLLSLGMVSMAQLKPESSDGYVCIIDFSNVKLTVVNIISLCIIFLNFFVPLVLMTVLYSIVSWRLWSREVPGDEVNRDNRRRREAMKTAKKVTRMMIAVVVFFLLCWFPFHVFVIFDSIHRLELPYAALKFIVLLANAYSAINPLIYLSINSKFRKEFVIIMGKCFRRLRLC